MKNIIKKGIGIVGGLCVLLSSVSSFAMTTVEFENGMAKGIDYFNRGLYYEARDEFQWFCDFNWGKMNEGQQKYALDYLGGTKQKIYELNNMNAYSVFNGEYKGGGIPYDGFYIGQWWADISKASANSLVFSISQGESDYCVSDAVLTRQSDGSYRGAGFSSWGMSYFTVWIENSNCISVTVSGSADTKGTNTLYKY